MLLPTNHPRKQVTDENPGQMPVCIQGTPKSRNKWKQQTENGRIAWFSELQNTPYHAMSQQKKSYSFVKDVNTRRFVFSVLMCVSSVACTSTRRTILCETFKSVDSCFFFQSISFASVFPPFSHSPLFLLRFLPSLLFFFGSPHPPPLLSS